MKIKICGITNLADAQLCRELNVDFIGLIRAPSERRISLADATGIASKLGTHPQPVLLFRDSPIDEFVREVRGADVQWVQLHGGENAAFAAEARAQLPGLRLIKAVEVIAGGAAAALRQNLTGLCEQMRPDVVVLDRPKGSGTAGFDDLRKAASVVRGLGVEVWCAGGLTPENVGEAIRDGGFDGVDVARGVERSPGFKDAELLRAFLRHLWQ
ncbi:MAG: phosphoribosylanthranilate isomerase [Phycisphaerales bacterium]|nr:phosphoribosylanthranilate isomerase [Phycisphaerales bacterium]